MQTLSICCSLIAVLSVFFMLPVSIGADQAKELPDQASLQASAAASLAWLQIVDKGEYGKSWDQSSKIMQATIDKAGWETVLNKMRKPLGAASSRQVLDQRTAKDPQGLPKGDYIVMFYKTDFSGKHGAHELVTLYFDHGTWNVLTYQVD